MKIVIGIPAFNEEKNIAGILIKLKKISQHVIVCDDGSNDLTAKIAEELDAIVIQHKKNLGYGSAIKSIFLKAHEVNADVLVTFDADGQHRIEDISTILEPIKKNIADVVIGSRFLNTNQEIPKYRKIGIQTITKLTNITGGTKITDSQSGFRAYNKKILENIRPTEIGMGISTEILIKTQRSGYKITEVPITILYEGDTSTHNPVSHGTSVIFSTLKYVAIERPLTFYGIPGFIFLCIGIILGTVFMITATILHSIISVVREKR